MSLADTAVRDFGTAMGLPTLAFNDRGALRLKFDRRGTLSIERTLGGALLQLARPYDRYRDGVLERALDLCHYERGERNPPDVGLSRGGDLVFSVGLGEADLTRPGIEQAFQLLCRLHDQLAP